jgi:Ala-tRNA(Pro) deacylase
MNTREFLQSASVPFDVLPHPSTYTAQHLAHTLEVPGDLVAKTVLLHADDEFVLAVLPATHQVALTTVRECLHANSVELASEDEMTKIFPDCDRGVAPPFGAQYGLVTIVDRSLTEDEHIVFEGNSHEEAIRLSYQDYENLEHPRVESFTIHN